MRTRLSATGLSVSALAITVVLVLVACGLDASGILEDTDGGVDDGGGQDGTLDLTDGGGPEDASPFGPIADGGSCLGGEWSPVVRAEGTTSCPLGYTAVDLLQDWTAPASACTCNASDSIPNVCTMSAVSATSKACNKKNNTSVPVNGTCVDVPGPATSIGLNIAGGPSTAVRSGTLEPAGGTVVRVCVPSQPLADAACSPTPPSDAGLTSCLIQRAIDRDAQACPLDYPNRSTLSQISDSRQCSCTYQLGCRAHFEIWNQKSCKGPANFPVAHDLAGAACVQLSPPVTGASVSLRVTASNSVLTSPSAPTVTGTLAAVDYTVCCP